MGVLVKTFVFKLKPTRTQEAGFERYLAATRMLYNAALEHRITAYKTCGVSITRFSQAREIKDIRRLEGFEWLMDCHVHPLQESLGRLDKAYKAFFRRLKTGGKAGFPRFKPKQRWQSFMFPEYGNGVSLDQQTNRLNVSKVGNIRVRLHRQIKGTPKTVSIVRKPDGWYAHIVCEIGGTPQTRSFKPGDVVGMDMGVANFLTLSTGDQVSNPSHLKAGLQKLRKEQKSLSRKKKGSNRRRKHAQRVAKAHLKIARQRRDFHHKTARNLIDHHPAIAAEKLQIKNMVRSAKGTREQPGRNVKQKAGLNRSISDAGWAQFLHILGSKAEEAGTQIITVNPKHTSQTCNICGHTAPENRLTQAIFGCVKCNHQTNADINAAQNIRARAMPIVETTQDHKTAVVNETRSHHASA